MRKLLLVISVLFFISLNAQDEKTHKISPLVNELPEDNKEFLKKYRIRKDDFMGSTIVYPRHRNTVYPYLIIYKNVVTLKFITTFSGSKWMFMNTVYFKLGDEMLSFELNNIDRQIKEAVRGVSSARIVETSDMFVNADIFETLNKIANYKTPIPVRISGENGRYNYEVGPKYSQSYFDIIELYNHLTSN